MRIVFTVVFILSLTAFFLQSPEVMCMNVSEEFPEMEFYMEPGICSTLPEFSTNTQIWPGDRNAMETCSLYLNGDGYKDLIFTITIISDLLILIFAWILMFCFFRKECSGTTE